MISYIAKAKNHALLFDLATSLPISLENLAEVQRSIPQDFFQDSEEGQKRKTTFNKACAERALAERKYLAAINYFTVAGNKEKADESFNTALSEGPIASSASRLVDFAQQESNPTNRAKKLTDIVLTFSREGGISALDAYLLANKHQLKLAREVNEQLQTKTAKEMHPYNFSCKSREDHTAGLIRQDAPLLLEWAKLHASENPYEAYDILSQQNYNGQELTLAIIAGLSQPSGTDKAGFIYRIPPKHLEAAYSQAQFPVKVRIAQRLEDSAKLQELSREAAAHEDLQQQAYPLWFQSKADPTEQILAIRAKIIQDSIKDNGWYRIPYGDQAGLTQAYNEVSSTALHAEDPTQKFKLYSQAYDLADRLGNDEKRLFALGAMITLNPARVLRHFSISEGDEIEVKIKKGRAQVLAISTVASNHNVPQEALEAMISV